MELDGSLPYSRELAICPYPEPDQPSLSPVPNLSKIHFNIFFYAWVFQVVTFRQVSPLKPCMHLSSPLYVPHVLPMKLPTILLKEDDDNDD
jgi:hypothetical protein